MRPHRARLALALPHAQWSVCTVSQCAKALENTTLTGRFIVTSFKTQLKNGSLDNLRELEDGLVASGVLRDAPRADLVLSHMAKIAGVGDGLTLTRAAAYVATPEATGFDTIIDSSISTSGFGPGSQAGAFILHHAVHDLGAVQTWVTSGVLHEHASYSHDVPADIVALVPGTIAAFAEVIFFPAYIKKCATDFVSCNFGALAEGGQRALQAVHHSYAATEFSRKMAEALICDDVFRPLSIQSKLVTLGEPLSGSAHASKSFNPERRHAPAPSRVLVLTCSGRVDGVRQLKATWRPLVPPALASQLQRSSAHKYAWYAAPGALNKRAPASVPSRKVANKVSASSASSSGTAKPPQAPSTTVGVKTPFDAAAPVPRADGFIHDDAVFAERAEELKQLCLNDGRFPTIEAQRRTVAVQLSDSSGTVAWHIGKVPSNGYSIASDKTQVQFGPNDAPFISFSDHISLSALCFLDEKRRPDPAAHVPRVVRQDGVESCYLEELPVGDVPSVWALDELMRHCGPINKHRSSFTMVKHMLEHLPAGEFVWASPADGSSIPHVNLMLLANCPWLLALSRIHNQTYESRDMCYITREALPFSGKGDGCLVTSKEGRKMGLAQGGSSVYAVKGRKVVADEDTLRRRIAACNTDALQKQIRDGLTRTAARAGTYVMSHDDRGAQQADAARQPAGARPQIPSVRMRSLQEGLAPPMVARLDQNFSDTYGSAESTGPLAMDPAGGADVIAGLP